MQETREKEGVYLVTDFKVAGDRDRAIGTAVSQIERQFGKGSIMRMGDEGLPKVASISTGALALDPAYAEAIGVDIENLYFSQPDNGEQALEIADTLVRSGALDLVVVDSVAALVPRAEIEGEMGDSHVGLQARLMSQALRKLSGSLSRSGTTAIFINQLREKIGVMFGSPETTPGGRALKFYASVRLDIRRIGALKVGNETVGNQTKVTVVKNKVASPFKTVEFDVMYGEGISREGSVLDVGIEHDVVQKSGAWFAYGDERLGQGRENAKQFLKENDEVRERILEEIYEKLGLLEPVETADEVAEEPAGQVL